VAQGDLRGTLTASVNSVTNPTVASGSVAVSVGDLVFGTMSQQTNLTATTTITDNLGNTYAYVNAGTDAGTVSIRSFYARVTVAGTLTTVNVPASASTNDASVVADVIAGPFQTSPLDANPANATDATTPFTCPATGVLAHNSEVVMAAIAIAGNQTVAATSPSILAGTVARANASVGQSRRVVSATTSVAPEFTGTSATAGQVTASFKLATTGTAAQTITKAAQSASGTETLTGTAANAQIKAAQVAAGTVVVPVTGTAQQTITKAAQAASGTETFSGTAAQSTTKAAQAAAGAEGFTATAAQTISTAAQAAEGTAGADEPEPEPEAAPAEVGRPLWWQQRQRHRKERHSHSPKARARKKRRVEEKLVEFNGKPLLGRELPKPERFRIGPAPAYDRTQAAMMMAARKRHQRRLVEDDDWLMTS
jgi:hypothetical protein